MRLIMIIRLYDDNCINGRTSCSQKSLKSFAAHLPFHHLGPAVSQCVRRNTCVFGSVHWSRKVGTCALQTATVACWNMSTEAYLLAHPQPCGHCVARHVGVSPKSSVMSDTFAGSTLNEEGWRCKPEALFHGRFSCRRVPHQACGGQYAAVRKCSRCCHGRQPTRERMFVWVPRQVKPTRCAVWSSSKPLGIRVVEGPCIPFR